MELILILVCVLLPVRRRRILGAVARPLVNDDHFRTISRSGRARTLCNSGDMTAR